MIITVIFPPIHMWLLGSIALLLWALFVLLYDMPGKYVPPVYFWDSAKLCHHEKYIWRHHGGSLDPSFAIWREEAFHRDDGWIPESFHFWQKFVSPFLRKPWNFFHNTQPLQKVHWSLPLFCPWHSKSIEPLCYSLITPNETSLLLESCSPYYLSSIF